MKIRFTKMHGLGNDFIVIDAISQSIDLTKKQIRYLADRHYGIGCDQLLLVEKPLSHNAQFKYRIFNADGSEVAQCGNGARCFARFVRDQHLCFQDEICVDTHSGQLTLYLQANDLVKVNMGVPRHAPVEIPLACTEETLLYRLNIHQQAYDFAAVSMGNPHAVIQVEDVAGFPVADVGSQLESHAFFPQRANIGFMQVIDRQTIQLRVFERGAGETLACGSGACAAVVTGILQGLLDHEVRVNLRGGNLQISWLGRGESVWMTGSATRVFNGEIELPQHAGISFN
jgi:diaminopimelate epimerase